MVDAFKQAKLQNAYQAIKEYIPPLRQEHHLLVLQVFLLYSQ